MQLTTTFKLLRKAGACKPRYEFLRKALPRPFDLQTEDEGEFCDGCGEQHGELLFFRPAENRSKTFPGIAQAMALQWGG